MAYQTGTVASPSDLATLLKNFAVANGWTLAGDVVSKGGCHVELTAPSGSELRIRGARNGLFSGVDLCPRYSRILNTTWPSVATYHIVAFDSPDTVWCTINFGTIYYMHVGFGNLQKYGTWNGGMWFHAQHTTSNSDAACLAFIDGMARPYYSNSPNNCAMFWSQQDYSPWGIASNNKCSFLHCELRGEVWPATGSVTDSGNFNMIHCPTILQPTQKANPNAFNGQTVLTPFQLFLQNTDGHMMSIGHVGHLRFLKMTNYNPGDTIQIGSDRWRLFPWHRLDATVPDGVQNSNSGTTTGVLGVAVRYDGP